MRINWRNIIKSGILGALVVPVIIYLSGLATFNFISVGASAPLQGSGQYISYMINYEALAFLGAIIGIVFDAISRHKI